MVCQYKIILTITDFTTVPSSLTIAVGEEAVFQCHYPGATINWRINGTAVVSSLSITVTSSGEQPFDTLTITARPEYNGTEVVCVALLPDFSIQQTSPAFLINIGSKTKAFLSISITIIKQTLTKINECTIVF